MSHKAKPVLIIVGAILIAMFPLSRWIASRIALRENFSAVTVEITPDTFSRSTDTSGLAVVSGRTDPQFLAAQVRVIKGPEILNRVIEKLNLVKKLSPPGKTMPMQWVTETLSRSIIVQEQRNTLIEIGVYNADKQLAADIANTIAITYRDKRIEEPRKRMDESLADMKAELKTKRDELGRLFQEASRIRQEDHIVDTDPERADAVISIREGREKTSTNRYVEKKSAYLMAKQLLLALEQRYTAQKLDNAVSIKPVKIWQTAVPALPPAGPDVASILNAIGGSLGGIGVLLILVALFMKSQTAQRNANGGTSGSTD